MSDSPMIFLSYATPDRDRVLEIHDFLSADGLDLWIDCRQLKGGQNLDFEIKRALGKAAVIVTFLSANSIDRRGYVQREVKIALDQAKDRLADDIYVIPVALDDSPIPDQLADLHVIRSENGDIKTQLVEAIRHQLERLGVDTARTQVESNLRWGLSTYRDSWDGLPGYEVEFQLLNFSSTETPQVREISDVIRGWLASETMEQRLIKFDQMPDAYSFGDPRSFRQNTWDASCGEPKIKERVICISYSVWWYGARAAHPNQFFRTFAFTLDPVTQIEHLKDVFEDEAAALSIIRDEARRQLLSIEFEGMLESGESIKLQEGYVHSGTEEWGQFDNFVFGQEGIDILFSCYQVAPYAFGPQGATVAYAKVVRLMRKEYALALGIEHMMHAQPPWPGGSDTPDASSAGSGKDADGAS